MCMVPRLVSVKLRNGVGYWSPKAEDLQSGSVYEDFGYYGVKDSSDTEIAGLEYKTLKPDPSAITVEFDPSNKEQAEKVYKAILDRREAYYAERGEKPPWIENMLERCYDSAETASLRGSRPQIDETSPSRSRSNSVDETGAGWGNNAQKDAVQAGVQHNQAAEGVEFPGCGARLMKRIARVGMRAKKATANAAKRLAARVGSLVAQTSVVEESKKSGKVRMIGR